MVQNILIALPLVISVCLYYFAKRKYNKISLLRKYKTSEKIAAVQIGKPAELSGSIIVRQSLTSPYTKTACIYYKYITEQKYLEKDTVGRLKEVWKPLAPPTIQRVPFYLKDSSETILINPDDSEVINSVDKEEYITATNLQHPEHGQRLNDVVSTAQIIVSTMIHGNEQRIREEIIPTRSHIYVYGIISMEGANRYIKKIDPYPFIISTISKSQLIGADLKKSYLLFFLSLVFLIIFVILAYLFYV